MKAKKLSDFTTDELETELAKRNGSSGKDWYFMHMDDESNSVWLVHKRFWHLNHHIDDRHIEEFVSLPEGMHECQESLFDFAYTAEEAERKLLNLGYEKLPTQSCWSALVVQCMSINGKFYRVDMQIDTVELKAAVEQAMKDYGHEFANRDPAPFESFDAYKSWMVSVVNKHKAMVKFTEGDGGCGAFVINKKLYNSLPKYPVGYYEEDEIYVD